jgi:hypothetical protein
MAFNDNISTLTGTSTFFDWFQKENNEIISKLNLITVSSVTGGDGILVGLSASSGLATLSIGGTSGVISRGLTFAGPLSFLGETVLPNISIKITGITTGSSGYTFGNVVRITSTGYTWARADSADNAEVVGVISSMNPSYSVVTLSGRITGNFTSVAGGTLSPGCVYFLDAATAGFVTTSEPNIIGQVSKPVMIGLGETAGMVVQYRGNFLNSTTSGGAGQSGSNVIYITFPNSPDPRSFGFTGGVFLSHAPHLFNSAGNTFFNKVLVDTGRTAISGWFLSGSKNYIYRTYSAGTPYYNLPWEEDYIVGMIQNVTVSGSNLIYEIVTKGESTVVPTAIKNTASGLRTGPWYISGTTYAIGVAGPTAQVVSGVTSNSSIYQPIYQLGRVFTTSTSSWFVDPKPLVSVPVSSSFRTTTVAETLTTGSNKAFNGDFSIWQRNTGKTQYTSSGNVYFADNWIRRQSGFDVLSVQSIQRQTFALTSTDVEGTPEYFVDVKCLEDTTFSTRPTGCVYSIGHVIDNIESFSGSSITVSFYAKTAIFNSNFKINVYFSRYGNGSLQEKTVIGQITPQANWTKHTLTYDVPAFTGVGSFSNDYVEIGLDLSPLVLTAFDNAITTATNLTISVASMCVYDGTYNAPQHMFTTNTEKLNVAQKYYYTTYTDSQTQGSATMLSSTEPTLNTFSFTHLPNAGFGLLKLPSIMRSSPSVSVFSPYSGVSNQMFNYTASVDQKDTSGTRGYNGAVRSAPLGTQVVSTTADTSTVRVNTNAGSVFYDVLNCHLTADASYPI